MAKAFISHSSVDKEFVLRLAQDLNRNWIDVWLDEHQLRVGADLADELESNIAGASHLVIVLSVASLKSEWVSRELNWAASREKEGLAMTIVPIRLQDVALPADLDNRTCADFFAGYEIGLKSLLEIFSRARVGLRTTLPGRRIVSAQRGRPASPSIPSPSSFLAVGGRDWTFAAAFETVGEKDLREPLSSVIGYTLNTALQKFMISGPESLGQYLSMANSAALLFKVNNGLGIEHPVGAKMSLLVNYKNTVCISTLGACGALSLYTHDDGYILKRIESAWDVNIPVAEGYESGISVSAPIGFMKEEPKPDWKQIELNAPGDFVALATFRFARDEQMEQLGSALAERADRERIAVMLAESHWPSTADSLCGLLIKETKL